MRPVSHTLIDHVRAPIDTVFAALTDPRCLEQWLPGCSAVLAQGPVRKGSKLRAQFGPRTTEFDVVDYQPPNTFGWVERGQRRNSKTFFRLDSAETATAVTIRQVWTPPSISAWVRGRLFPKRNVQRHCKTIVAGLRAIVVPRVGTPDGSIPPAPAP
jgi:uncharacterized protein YndB with AHSA1/START domain